MARILFLDLETFGFNFNADAGFIMCGSYKWKGEDKVYTITRKNPTKWTKNAQDDKHICEQLANVIRQADVIVTHNGRSFDWRFLQTRMLKHRLGYLPPVPHEDTLKIARKLKMRRSLDNIQKFFKLTTQKETMDLATVWMPAGAGNPRALKQVIKRCESDVKLLEEVYNLLAPLSTTHPNVALINGIRSGCPLCGKKTLRQEGYKYALRHYRIQYQCTTCRRWSTSNPIVYTKGVPNEKN